MLSSPGWKEPGQRPEFEEITVVLRGLVRIEHEGGVTEARAGQAIITRPGEWVRYSTPAARGNRIRRHLSAGVLAAGGTSRCPGDDPTPPPRDGRPPPPPPPPLFF